MIPQSTLDLAKFLLLHPFKLSFISDFRTTFVSDMLVVTLSVGLDKFVPVPEIFCSNQEELSCHTHREAKRRQLAQTWHLMGSEGSLVRRGKPHWTFCNKSEIFGKICEKE